ncbi:FadR family transcriptional regulator [Ktedonosporobacter rubrisoli]|uniref:FadR family transcriptional regulator n=1 Tax=Ktedonosporobacter rubrisoli TaxID=2509675 RepID=A0A4P6JQU5_KTERU|nr:FCD domain-containing protein [Ktedonosporobacter rubrisoli]QBD77807.1 FadR family transcriptional regulator [Ktedonosporobacter rubrisoli]
MTLVTKENGSTYRPGYEIVAARIIEFIKISGLQPGDRLPTEQKLGIQLGVSRAMVREAVKILTASGHVKTRRGSGTYVGDGTQPLAAAAINFSMPVDPEHIRALFEFRSMQEMLTARLAAERITLAELRSLDKFLSLCRQGAETEQWKQFIENYDAFHLGIAQAAHNIFLAETVAFVLKILRGVVKMLMDDEHHLLLDIVEQQEKIFNSIKEGDADNAAQDMRSHIEDILLIYQQNVRKRLSVDILV